ncbi:MAG: extracellular solute-binding protein [Dehalococcoidia bacterium]|nr:extracellular solute-binding protein [Dehalococcoidia bacterium]
MKSSITRVVTAMGLLALLALLAACAPAAPSAPTPAPKATSGQPAAATPAAATAAPKATGGPATTATTPTPVAKSSALDQLIEGARKEGVVRVNLMSPIGDKGAQRLIDALNKKYSLNLKMEYTASASMPRTAAQVLTELKTGGAPSWDVIQGTASNLVDLVQANMVETFDWAGAFPNIPAGAVFYGGANLSVATTYQVPIYNKNLVRQQDVPRKWEDLLDPKWKGKLVVPSQVDMYVWFTEMWGEERTTRLVEGLVKQDPIFAEISQVVPRVASGEYPVAAYIPSGQVFQAQKQGAPVEFADEVDPVRGQDYLLSVPKKAQHPNAAKLFVGFNMSQEAQQVWWEEAGRSSHLVPESPMVPVLKGKKLVFGTTEFDLKESPRLTEKYSKILGLK